MKFDEDFSTFSQSKVKGLFYIWTKAVALCAMLQSAGRVVGKGVYHYALVPYYYERPDSIYGLLQERMESSVSILIHKNSKAFLTSD